MAAFVMTLPRLDEQERAKLYVWAKSRCHEDSFSIVDEEGECGSASKSIVGGRLRRKPRSEKHLQALLGNSLKNWKIERENQYDRGWLRLLSEDEDLAEVLGLVRRAEALRRDYVQQFRHLVARERVRRRDQAICRAVEKLGAFFARRQKGSFDALAESVRLAAADLKAKRAARAAVLNEQRFGADAHTHQIFAQYTPEELDGSQEWPAIKRHRSSTWGRLDLDIDTRNEKATRERIQEQMYALQRE